MKNVIAFIALVASLSSFAQERVILDSSEVSVNASEATLVRTSQTPDTVKVNFQVPMANSFCAETNTRMVPGICYRTIYARVREDVCVRRNPVSNNCMRVEARYTQRPVRQSYTCPVAQTYCARYAVGTQTERDTVKIKFKNLLKIGGSEEETFVVRAEQKRLDSGNVVYSVVPEKTFGEYEVKDRGFLGSDKYVIQPKKD